MLGFGFIRRHILMYQVAGFILKYTDTVRLVTRDRSFMDAAREAVKNYMEESFNLLPRRYQLILQELHADDLLSEQRYQAYRRASFLTLSGGSLCEIVTDEETGEKQLVAVSNENFPWIDSPTILDKVSARLLERIKQLEADAAELRRDEAPFAKVLMLTHQT